MTRLTRRRVAGHDHWRVWPDRPGSPCLGSKALREPPTAENNLRFAVPFFAYFGFARRLSGSTPPAAAPPSPRSHRVLGPRPSRVMPRTASATGTSNPGGSVNGHL